MTALASGASVTVAVRDGGTIAVSTNGGLATAVVTLTEGGSSAVSLGPLPERRTFGPYKEGASVVLTNASCGSFDYDAQTSVPSALVSYQLGQSSVAVSVTGTTSETTLATISIPAGAMGSGGGLLIYSTWTNTNSANNKTPRIRLGGQALLTPTITATATLSDIRRVRNRNSAASQVVSTSNATPNSTGATTAAITTLAVDTTTAQDLTFTGQLALGTETLTLESYEVWLLP